MKQTTYKWLNHNQTIENITLLEVPKHRVYVDVLGNGGAFLLQKKATRLEVFNDTYNELLSFLLDASLSEQSVSGLVSGISLQQDGLERLRNLMIENVSVERLIGIYDGPDTLFYIDLVHHQLSEKEQTEILMNLASLKGKVMLIAPSDLVILDWNKVALSYDMNLLMNFQNEQMSLFAFASMEGVMNHD